MTMASAEDLATVLKSTNGRLIVNVSPDAIGHTIGEIDNFMRMKLTGEYDAERPSFFFCEDFGERLATMQRLFGEKIFDNWVISEYGGFLAGIVANAYPDLTVDVGISSFKIAPPRGREPIHWEPPRFFRMRYRDMYTDHLMYHRRFVATSDRYPYDEMVECSEQVDAFIGAKGAKVAAVQIKDVISTGNATAVQGEEYEPALALLKDAGYRLVLVGRERMPESWAKFGVVDYANSPIASFENDFRVMKRADVGLVGASGISLFLELFDKPLVHVNTKMPATPPWGRKCIYVPSLFTLNADGRTPTLLEHLQYNLTSGIGYNPAERTPFPPTPAQIAEAVREMLTLAGDPTLPLTERQRKYKSLDPHGCVGFSSSRISDSFLRDHEQLL